MKLPHIPYSAAIMALMTIALAGPACADNKSQNTAQAAVIAAPAPVPVPANAKIQMPPPEAMIIMIRSSLVALSQANVTGNYQVLNALGSENFRAANPPARLAEVFAPFRSNKIDLAPVVFVTPQLSQQPQITDGKLRMIGFFPTQPMRVDYDLQFEPSGGVWKLLGISVNLNPVQTPPQAAARPAPQNPQQSR